MYKKIKHKMNRKIIGIIVYVSMLCLAIGFAVKQEREIVNTMVLGMENTVSKEKELEDTQLLIEKAEIENAKERENALSVIEKNTSNIVQLKKEKNKENKIKAEEETNKEIQTEEQQMEERKKEEENTQEKEVLEEKADETKAKEDIKEENIQEECDNQQCTENQANDRIQLSSKDYDVLVRIVEAEATGEDMKGKILVANVILNRVQHERFPNTVTDVVFETCGGSPQFSPTADGRFDTVRITEGSKEAVDRALGGEDFSNGALYFSARSHADPNNMSWFDTHLKWLFKYGGHEFYALKE